MAPTAMRMLYRRTNQICDELDSYGETYLQGVILQYLGLQDRMGSFIVSNTSVHAVVDVRNAENGIPPNVIMVRAQRVAPWDS
jgi:hypothetical protein